MSAGRQYTQRQLLEELEPVVEKELDRHLSAAKDWMPHEYVPWSEGRNFAGVLRRRGVGRRPVDGQRHRTHRTRRQPAHRGQPPQLPPGDLPVLRPRRRLGHVDRPLDRRGGPARHRHPRLPAHEPGGRPRRARARADDPHDAGVPAPTSRHAPHRGVCQLPGAGHPDLAPQHRQVHRGRSPTSCWPGSPSTRTCTWSSTATSWRRPWSSLRTRPCRRCGTSSRASRCPARHRGLHPLAADRPRRHLRPADPPRRGAEPVLRHWKIFDLEGLSPEAEDAREKLGAFMDDLDAKASRFEEKRAQQQARQAARRQS